MELIKGSDWSHLSLDVSVDGPGTVGLRCCTAVTLKLAVLCIAFCCSWSTHPELLLRSSIVLAAQDKTRALPYIPRFVQTAVSANDSPLDKGHWATDFSGALVDYIGSVKSEHFPIVPGLYSSWSTINLRSCTTSRIVRAGFRLIAILVDQVTCKASARSSLVQLQRTLQFSAHNLRSSNSLDFKARD